MRRLILITSLLLSSSVIAQEDDTYTRQFKGDEYQCYAIITACDKNNNCVYKKIKFAGDTELSCYTTAWLAGVRWSIKPENQRYHIISVDHADADEDHV